MTIEQNLNTLIETKDSIKNAIINKGVDVSDADTFASYADKISEINQSKDCPIYKSQNKTTTITKNGHSVVTPDSNFDGLSSVDITVNVPTQTYKSQNKDYTIRMNGTTSITPDSGFNGISGGTITVDVPTQTYKSQNKDYTIRMNGTTSITPDSGFNGISGGTITVDVPTSSSKLQNKNYIISENGTTSIIPDSGFNGISGGTIIVDVPTSPSGNDSVTFDFTDCTYLDNSYGHGFYNNPYLIKFTQDLPYVSIIKRGFEDCKNLKEFSSNMPKITKLDDAFSNCSKLEKFDCDLKLVNTVHTPFDYCYSLKTFNSDLSSLNDEENAKSLFLTCINLTNVTLTGTLNCAINFSSSTLLTVESMVSIMNALVDLTGQSSKTMKFGDINLLKLSDEQKAIATNKNWILA